MAYKKHFSFFESYYEAFKDLPPEVVGEVVIAMGKYYFEDEIVDLHGVGKVVFELIKPVLENSKEKAQNGRLGGAPVGNTNASKTTENNRKTTKNNRKQPDKDKDKERDKDLDMKKDKEFKTPPISPPPKTLTQIVKDRNLSPELESKILEWLKYKTERKEGYKETGLNALVSEIQNNVERYSLDAVIDCINKSMSRGYKGIIFDLIKQNPTAKDNVTPFNPTDYLLQQIREEESANG